MCKLGAVLGVVLSILDWLLLYIGSRTEISHCATLMHLINKGFQSVEFTVFRTVVSDFNFSLL